MKKIFLAIAVGCVLCSMATGCGSSVNAQPNNIAYTETETTGGSLVLMETGVSTEADTVSATDIFETAGLNLSNVKTVSVLSVAEDNEDGDEEFAVQVYTDAQKKINEFSYSYEYAFDGGKYKLEVSDNLKKNISARNCEWMSSYSEVTSCLDGTKYPQECVTIDCSINDRYEMVYIHVENPMYGDDMIQLEDRYYIKDNMSGTLDVIAVSIMRDTAVYGDGAMPVTKKYLADLKADIYAEFCR